MIRAIETQYKGYRFRSRLEARWAVFFDALGIEWQYEPEGFVLADGTRYLPDFFLPGFCGPNGLWVEVKPESGDATKASAFARDARAAILLADGMPSGRYFRVFGLDFADDEGLEPINNEGAFWDRYLVGGKNAIEYRLFFSWGDETPPPLCGRVEQAVFAARSARFEFGQSGARK